MRQNAMGSIRNEDVDVLSRCARAIANIEFKEC